MSVAPHPSPPRSFSALLLLALAAGPAGWIAQLVFGYGWSGHLCFPHAVALRQPPAADERIVLLVVNLVCLAVVLSGLGVAWRIWRRLRERFGRDRFLAFCGMLSGGGFTVAILFDTAFVLLTPTCWSFR